MISSPRRSLLAACVVLVLGCSGHDTALTPAPGGGAAGTGGPEADASADDAPGGSGDRGGSGGVGGTGGVASRCAGGKAGAGGMGGMEAATHRAVAAGCPTNFYQSSMAGYFDGPCASDADCLPAGESRCVDSPTGPHCSLDQCHVDDDCGTNMACSCRDEPAGGDAPNGAGGGPNSYLVANRCVKAQCRTDADCPAGYQCSGSFPTTGSARRGVSGYYCHTPNDCCRVDADCSPPAGPGFTRQICAYAPETGAWACVIDPAAAG
jgi:hypothetical protein